MQPRSCATSTIRVASYSCANSCSALISGVSESIENRLSVTTRMPFSVSVARMRASFSRAISTSLWRKRWMFLVAACVPSCRQACDKSVDHDVIAGAHQPLDHAIAGSPAGGEQAHMLHAQEFADLALQRERERGVADQSGRSGAMHAELAHRLDGGFEHGRVRGQAEIILRGEIHALEQVAFVGARLAFGVRAHLGRTAERPKSGACRRICCQSKKASTRLRRSDPEI